MNCPHTNASEGFELTWCKDCGAVRYPEADGWTLPNRAQCIHGAVGLLFFLHRNSGHAKQIEWCPGCGAYRFRPEGEWVAPA